MIRIVLAGRDGGDWRIFRQEQWMAEVRRAPESAGLARVHFDIPEAAYREVLGAWRPESEGSSRGSAVARLAGAGAVEVVRR